jgi:hypothetical protein
VQFPCDKEGYASPNFQALLEACTPATFGCGNKDVLDPEYCKALCLDADMFDLNTKLPLDDICEVKQ